MKYRLLLLASFTVFLVGCAELFGSMGRASGPSLNAIRIANSQSYGQSGVFGSRDSIFASVQLRQNRGYATVTWRLFAKSVEGVQANTEYRNMQVNVDVEGNQSARYSLRPPSNGWRAGTYTIYAELYIDGQRYDSKSVTFRIDRPWR